MQLSNPTTYLPEDVAGRLPLGKFYELEFQKVKHSGENTTKKRHQKTTTQNRFELLSDNEEEAEEMEEDVEEINELTPTNNRQRKPNNRPRPDETRAKELRQLNRNENKK
ncbi:hypothetical protein Trydic_g7790 [Trypoxylus dichotomus]